MPLNHRTIPSNDVRVPRVPVGEAILVGRYRSDAPKAAILNPEDLRDLEDARAVLDALHEMMTITPDPLSERVHFDEDRADEASVTDPKRIEALLGL